MERFDYEYKRDGVANLFMFFQPLMGKQHAKVTEHELYPDAEKIVIAMDNLNTHLTASFYETFEPEEVLHLANRLKFHYTPKHGSWLNMTKIE